MHWITQSTGMSQKITLSICQDRWKSVKLCFRSATELQYIEVQVQVYCYFHKYTWHTYRETRSRYLWTPAQNRIINDERTQTQLHLHIPPENPKVGNIYCIFDTLMFSQRAQANKEQPDTQLKYSVYRVGQYGIITIILSYQSVGIYRQSLLEDKIWNWKMKTLLSFVEQVYHWLF